MNPQNKPRLFTRELFFNLLMVLLGLFVGLQAVTAQEPAYTYMAVAGKEDKPAGYVRLYEDTIPAPEAAANTQLWVVSTVIRRNTGAEEFYTFYLRTSGLNVPRAIPAVPPSDPFGAVTYDIAPDQLYNDIIAALAKQGVTLRPYKDTLTVISWMKPPQSGLILKTPSPKKKDQ